MPGISGGSSGVPALIIATKRAALLPALTQALKLASEEFAEMGRFLVVGAFLAALMQTLVPQETIKVLATNPVNSVLVMAGLAFLLSLCSTVDAFLALSFARTFTTGSILTFLTFGPMVDIKTTTMFLGIFKRKTVVLLTVLPLVLTGIAGILLNVVGLK